MPGSEASFTTAGQRNQIKETHSQTACDSIMSELPAHNQSSRLVTGGRRIISGSCNISRLFNHLPLTPASGTLRVLDFSHFCRTTSTSRCLNDSSPHLHTPAQPTNQPQSTWGPARQRHCLGNTCTQPDSYFTWFHHIFQISKSHCGD